MDDRKEIKARAQRTGLPIGTWARLSSTPESRIHQPNLSNWLAGESMSEAKVKRVMKILEAVEDLVASTSIRPDLSDAANVAAALAKLAELRANPATAVAPWHRGAVAEADDDLSSASSVTEILSGATND